MCLQSMCKSVSVLSWACKVGCKLSISFLILYAREGIVIRALCPKPWVPLTARPSTYLHITKKKSINKKKQQWHVHGNATSVTKPNEHNDKSHHSSGIKCATQLDLVHIPLA